MTTWVVHKTINEALANVTELFPGKEVVMRLSAGEHIVSSLVLDANLSLSRLEIVAASNAPTIISSSISSTLLEVRAGSPPLKLQGLKLNGQILIEAGFDRAVEIAGCHFSASASQGRRLRASTFVRALLVSDGSVTVSDAVFEDLRGGALLVTGGEVRVYNSTFTENEAESGGALLVTGGKVAVGNSTFTDNKATDATEGGAIRVIGTNASLELANLTVITGSAGFGGSVASDVEWTYRLPAPLAHYVSDPEQDGTARNGAGSYDFDYPIPCAATLYGSSYNVKDRQRRAALIAAQLATTAASRQSVRCRAKPAPTVLKSQPRKRRALLERTTKINRACLSTLALPARLGRSAQRDRRKQRRAQPGPTPTHRGQRRA